MYWEARLLRPEGPPGEKSRGGFSFFGPVRVPALPSAYKGLSGVASAGSGWRLALRISDTKLK